jgi:hypothetical protein
MIKPYINTPKISYVLLSRKEFNESVHLDPYKTYGFSIPGSVQSCFHQVRVDWFMRGSAILLMFIAAGFFSASMHQLQELDVFGVWSPRVDRPWQNRHVWDARWGKLWGDMFFFPHSWMVFDGKS